MTADPLAVASAALQERLLGMVPALAGHAVSPRLRQQLASGLARRVSDIGQAAAGRDAWRGLASQLAWRHQRLITQREEAVAGSPDYEAVRRFTLDAARVDDEAERVYRSRLAHYRRECHREFPSLVGELRHELAQWSSAEHRLHDFFGTTKGLWDLEPGTWKNIEWTGLEAAAATLASWPELLELAQRLGRTRGLAVVPAPPEAAGNQDGPVPEYHVEALGRSEITGYTRGTNLSLLPASEMALLSDPLTEGIFFKRHAEGILTNLEYRTELEYWVMPDQPDGRLPPPAPQEQGPVIICTDTSGSMTGVPEQVAKALTLALARACRETGRGCFLIAFSSGIRCLDLSDPVASVAELAAFLARSFHGGTDLRPALAKSLELLDNPAWTQADLLIVSDFRVPKLMIKKSHLIDPIRSRHAARLHAVSISSGDPSDDLHIFDSSWHFRIGGGGDMLGIGRDQFKAQASIFPPASET